MAKELTDAQVEEEISMLLKDDDVKLAKKEMRIRYKRRQYLYGLRTMKKHGMELREAGITIDNIEAVLFCEESED